jgi:hypothetical protein
MSDEPGKLDDTWLGKAKADGWRMTEVTIPERPDDPEWRARWKARIKWVALALALFAAYMGAYYATVAIDKNGAFQIRQTYQIWYWELPSWSRKFFAIADWIDDRLHLAPCKNPPLRPLINKSPAIARSR